MSQERGERKGLFAGKIELQPVSLARRRLGRGFLSRSLERGRNLRTIADWY
jgi:hypothetical protein